MNLQIAYFDRESYIYGPGKHFVIWFQGCKLRCDGCWNEEMHEPAGGMAYTAADLIELISEVKGLEGVTILGGEPMDQAKGLSKLLPKIKALNLGVILYTGHYIESLDIDIASSVLKYVDLLIHGPYIKKQRILDHGLIGSKNKRISYLTERYRYYSHKAGKKVEVLIDESLKSVITGYPDENFIKILED